MTFKICPMKTLLLTILCFSIMPLSQAQQSKMRAPGLQDSLLLKDYRPKSIFKTTQTSVLKAKYPAIDTHMHAPRGGNLDSIAMLILKNMDEVGIQKTILFSGTGKSFDQTAAAFGKYPERFELWCGLDLSGFDKPGFGLAAIAELERCVKLGAKGVGEISDSGRGLIPREGILRIDDPGWIQFLKSLLILNCQSISIVEAHNGCMSQWMHTMICCSNHIFLSSTIRKVYQNLQN